MNSKVLKAFNKTIEKRDISENTKKTYLRNFKKINILLDNPTLKELKDISKVVKVTENLGIQQRKQIFNILGLVLNDKKYKSLVRDLTKNIIETSEKNKMSDKQKDKLISYSELKKKLDIVKKRYEEDFVCDFDDVNIVAFSGESGKIINVEYFDDSHY